MPPENEERSPGEGAASKTPAKRSEATVPPHEPSAWMRLAIDRRVAQLEAAGVARGVANVVVTPLTDTWSLAQGGGSVGDRSCDRCGVYVPPGLELFCGPVPARVGGAVALLVLGLCRTCRDVEVVGC